MNKQKIKYTVAFQLVCFSIILWVFAASGIPTEAKILQQAATPEPFLGPIYYSQENVSKIFDHEYPFFGGEGADNDVEPADSVMHYDGVRYNSPIPSRYGYDSHIGIDYTLLYEPVLAAANGTVLFAGWSDPTNHRLGYGLYIRMSHADNSNYRAWYGHLSTLTVETGETVTIDPMDPGSRSRIIGISGNTGNVFGPNGTCGDVNLDPLCGAHLHFEVRQIIGNKPVNPYGWVAPASTPDPWAIYDPPGNDEGATSYDLWETNPALISTADQYPGDGDVGLTEPAVNNGRMLLDDGSPDFTTGGTCWTAASGVDGLNGDYYWTTSNPGGLCVARWILPVDSFTPSGEYDLFAHLPNDATSLGAAYAIFHSGEVNDSIAVQGAYPNEAHGPWAYLGRYDFDMDGSERIVIYGQTIAGDAGNIVIADAVRLAPAFTFNPTGSIYISPNAAGTTDIDGLAYADEDIMQYTVGSDSWSLFFNGSVAGVTTNLNAFSIVETSDTILMSFDTPTTIPGIGAVDDSDIVQYTPLTNSFQMYLDGSTVGLTTDNADIDSIAFAPDGRLLISTVGRIPGTPFNIYQDEDLLIFNTAQTSFDLYFDGSDVSLTANGEDITGTWIDAQSGDIYLNTTGNFSVLNASGDGSDLFICDPNSVGSSTSCDFSSGLYWNGSGHGISGDLVDGLYVVQGGATTLIATASVTQSSDDAGYDAAPSLNTPPIVCTASNNLYATDHNEVYFGFCPDGTEVISGFRFTNIDVPQGAIIQEARIEFTTDGPFTNTLSVQFRGELTGNSSTFSAVIRPDNRPLTVATAPWNVPSTSSWAVWDNTQSPDLKAIIQEIVNQAGWSSDNALTIVVEPQPSTTPDGDRRVIAWDRENNSSHTAELTIWYYIP